MTARPQEQQQQEEAWTHLCYLTVFSYAYNKSLKRAPYDLPALLLRLLTHPQPLISYRGRPVPPLMPTLPPPANLEGAETRDPAASGGSARAIASPSTGVPHSRLPLRGLPRREPGRDGVLKCADRGGVSIRTRRSLKKTSERIETFY